VSESANLARIKLQSSRKPNGAVINIGNHSRVGIKQQSNKKLNEAVIVREWQMTGTIARMRMQLLPESVTHVKKQNGRGEFEMLAEGA
jgi:hypothetical protein